MTPAQLPQGPWQQLFVDALKLMDDVAEHGISDPFWTFGGGTVLMLRHNHRMSKDIDLFVPDPQYLGFVTPRLSQVAEDLTIDYVETGGYVKLSLPEGEIDVVAATNLTTPAFEEWMLFGRTIRVETSAEIVAKKMWFRGNTATARDLFDLAMVLEREPEALIAAAPWFLRYRDEFISQIHDRQVILKAMFEQIDVLSFTPSYEHCCSVVTEFLRSLPGEQLLPAPR